MTLKMTLSKDLVEELGGVVEQVPTAMGIEAALSIITVGPSLTVVTTSLFSPETFRAALHRWFRRNEDRVRFSAESGRDKFSIELGQRKATEMAAEITEVVVKFFATDPGGTGNAPSVKP